MRISHSKLETIINNPMDYFLSYKVKMSLKETKTAFQVGSAMHWGFENDTEDLLPWFRENGNEFQKKGDSLEQEQAEAMCHGYFKNKDQIFNEVLQDEETGKRLEVIDSWHELPIEGNLKSYTHEDEPHRFNGIIDLLILTEKGFIIIDYKSSSQIPEFSKYLDQIYRYIFMVEQNFADTPIAKIGIINVVKSKIKRMKNENELEFKRRWKRQYEEWPTRLINVNMFDRSKLEKKKIDEYIENLSHEADLADAIDRQNLYYINFKNAEGPYKSDYYDVYNKTENAEVLYTIKDRVYDSDSDSIANVRDCVKSDMEIPFYGSKVLYRYSDYKSIRDQYDEIPEENFNKIVSDGLIVSPELLDIYSKTYEFDKSHK